MPDMTHAKKESCDALLDFLAYLRGLYMVHQNAHWTYYGQSFYGDHLLFQRLYENIEEEVDGIAEKITAMYGPEAINSMDQMGRMYRFISEWSEMSEGCVCKRSFVAEERLQPFLDTLYEFLDEAGTLTLGLDDFIMALASAHETHLYLLRQKFYESTG